ncbi:LysM peptidoglycan-binding domain-containing protein [Roseibium suaedae]|uniref:Nucleoid-associated protein YgaU, contains BON and LysM domains n=1 Tax=Roseibium suaedae TaxID=735517 RepID=A0A1M7LLY0_9HYPH|nr:LysM peptidoglycan-binding domain-containing protein [Roseibium suaedae]SHM79223.1 Nucleoid-associated protein YgaU, contains BON and LysM domains [Roseibium suaedae]
MTKLALTRTLVVAALVGVAALVTAYLYRDKGNAPSAPQVASTPDAAKSGGTGDAASSSGETSIARSGAKSDKDAGVTEVPAAAKKGDLSFDVVSVEPTGETVVAGRSDPGAIVGLMANGKLVGKAIANQDGEWSIILDKPLSPGDYDVNLQALDENDNAVGDASGQRLAVSVPEDGKQQPLVVLNSPDAPSSVLQVPGAAKETETAAADAPATSEAPAADVNANASTGTQVAAAPEASAPVTDPKPEASASASGPADAASPDATATASPSAAASDTGSGSGIETGNGQKAAEAGSSDAQAPAAVASSEATTTAPTATATSDAPVQPQGQTQDQTQDQTQTPAGAPAAPALASQPSETAAAPAAAKADLVVTVDAVEAESGKVYTAGTGEAGHDVRIYVGDTLLGSGKVGDNGRWLVEGGMDLASGPVEVRADMIGADGNTVVARAAVTFERAQEQAIVLTRVEAAGEGGAEGANASNAGKTLPNVIIRKGDNLWNISRRLYGDGFRYTTIYQANKGQIRNPDLIYPGQVFLTPEGDLNWKPAQ